SNMIHPITLTFVNPVLEETFRRATLLRIRQQGQIAIIVGTLIYLIAGWMDQWFVSPQSVTEVWRTRLTVLTVPAVVFLLSMTRFFERVSNVSLASVGLAAGFGLIGIQMELTVENASFYYPMMVLATFYTYNFIGTRFIFALFVDLFLLLSYNLVFGIYMDYPLPVLIAHDIVIISANLIGGASGYLVERQRRMLYIREHQLDEKQKLHLHRALHDPLTGLPNRDLLHDRLEHAMVGAVRNQELHCGYFIDLDGFKNVNDTLGHDAGDRLLKYISYQMVASVREFDTVARISGDEFFVLAMNIGDRHSAEQLAGKLLENISRPVPGIPEKFRGSASIGLCMFPYEGMSASGIIRNADEAMYKVKCSGKGDYLVAHGDSI
ncbi:MAG: diguanylate cyclase, partial [Sulfurimonadaceae bacterium]|nr:diguanylate cyclase [Sulfurimonadaceae bacterium]